MKTIASNKLKNDNDTDSDHPISNKSEIESKLVARVSLSDCDENGQMYSNVLTILPHAE